MIRWIITFSLLAFGWFEGRGSGLLAMLLIVGLLGVIFPARKRTVDENTEAQNWERIEPARRGSEVDPTRPDEHPLLITHEIRRRR